MNTPRPDPGDELRAMVDTCVHCGFCLPACPTYDLWGEEMDSPRGRIQLMKLGLDGAPLTPATAEHFDRCLGCMACVPACPSGVEYDRLITAKRAEVESTRPRTLPQRMLRRMIFGLFPYPFRLRTIRGLLRVYQATRIDRLVSGSRTLARLAPSLSTMASLTPPLRGRWSPPRSIPPVGKQRAVVGMLLGCVQREFFPQVNAATARVLAAEGCRVVIPAGQGCCGALSGHSGRRTEAQRFARRIITEFERAGVETIVVNSAGCGSAMKDYAELLAGDEHWVERATALARKVRDFSEFLAELGSVAPRHRLPVTVAYHDACHLAHAQGVRTQPRQLLSAIPDVELREIADGEKCCGSAGVYNLLQPTAARELGDRKAVNVAATRAQLLVSANPGCAMQIAAAMRRDGASMPVAHIAEVLDAAIRGVAIAEEGRKPDPPPPTESARECA